MPNRAMFTCLALAALWACGAEPEAGTPCTTTADCALGEVCESTCTPASAPSAPAPEGTRVRFDLGASLTGEGFFDLPFPSDARARADGTFDYGAVPNPDKEALGGKLYGGLTEIASELRGASALAVSWLRFDGPLKPRVHTDILAASKDAPLLLLDIDPTSPERGTLRPVVAHTLEKDAFTPEHLLGVAPRPGFVLRPDTRYAVIVRRDAGDAAGKPLGVDPTVWALLHHQVPEASSDLGKQRAEALAKAARPMLLTLAELGVDPTSIAAFTVFTTGDAVADLHALSEQARAAHPIQISNLRVDPDDGAKHPRYCELLADVTYPQFQTGTPPWNTEGTFALDAEGKLVKQRDEKAPIVITLPHTPMPEGGYPLVMYFHGSGGVASQLVDRGYRPKGGKPKRGEGPAHILAEKGFAAVGSALPVSPDRQPSAGAFSYLNFQNLRAFRDLFRQGAIEQRLLLDALLTLEIPPSVVAACTQLQAPAGATGFSFSAKPVVAMGQSMGAQYVNLIGAIEPRIAAIVPTGGGGYWSWFIFQTQLIGDIPALLAGLLGTEAELSFLHPVMHMLQVGWEGAEPIIAATRVGRRPLPDHPARHVYEPVAPGDSYFPTQVFDAMALAYGHPQAEGQQWASMQTALARAGLEGFVKLPLKSNLESEDGRAYTGVVVQHQPDGYSDPHNIFVQLEAVKYQYACFFRTLLDTGAAIVGPGGKVHTDPCPAP